MRVPFSPILALSAILSPCFAAPEAIHWDFEQVVPAPGNILSIKSKTGSQELIQPDASGSPSISTVVRSASVADGNKQSVNFVNLGRNFLKIPAAAVMDIGANAPFTLELWINPRNFPEPNTNSITSTLIQKRGGAPVDKSKPGYQLGIAFDGKIVFRAEGRDGGAKTLISKVNVPLAQWSHIAVTRDETGVFRLYINGQDEVVAGGPRLPGSLENDGPFTVGANRFVQSTEFFYDGLIDDLRLSPAKLEPESFITR